MRKLFAAILMVLLCSMPVLAQEDNINTATSALQDVLSNLKQSVEKLGSDNDQLSSRDNAVRQQVLGLQMQLGQLAAQGDALNKSADRLHEKNDRRARQITRLEDVNFDLDNRVQKAEAGIKLVQRSLDAGYHEDQKLLLQLKGLTNEAIPLAQARSPESQAAVHRQKEKLKLMKMIYDSQQRQEALHASILGFQQSTPLLPAANALARQQILKAQIKDLESQIAAYPPQKPSANISLAYQWDNSQLHQLEGELKALERNYAQLKDLTDQMSKKAQNTRISVSEHIEGEKLQGSVNDLNHQAVGLRADLDDLRSQMVDLDKRKSHLETMVQQISQ